MRIDRNYSIKRDRSNQYDDSFDEIVDLVARARKEGKITAEESKVILNVAIRKQYQKEVKHFFTSFLLGHSNVSEKHTLLIQLRTKNTQYAG